MTAIVPDLGSSGSSDRSFFSRTIDSPATLLANDRISDVGGAVRGLYGSRKSPSRVLARRIRMTAESTTGIGMRVARTNAASEST